MMTVIISLKYGLSASKTADCPLKTSSLFQQDFWLPLPLETRRLEADDDNDDGVQ